MKTKWMKIVCSECRNSFPMYPDRLWYNFTNESYADPIGFCSEECIKSYQERKGW